MSLQLEFTGAGWFENSEGVHLTLALKPNFRAAAKQFCQEVQDCPGKDYTAVLKRYRPRSLDANAYFWVLCDQLARENPHPKRGHLPEPCPGNRRQLRDGLCAGQGSGQAAPRVGTQRAGLGDRNPPQQDCGLCQRRAVLWLQHLRQRPDVPPD